MSVLSDRDLAVVIASGHLGFEDWSGVIGPASIDVHLLETLTVPGLGFRLGSTREIVTLPADLMGQVQGCSTVGRSGLFVQNAGLIDPGFSGQITLELFNATTATMTLPAGYRIAQLSFTTLTTPARRPYGTPGVGRYQGQRGTTPPRDSA